MPQFLGAYRAESSNWTTSTSWNIGAMSATSPWRDCCCMRRAVSTVMHRFSPSMARYAEGGDRSIVCLPFRPETSRQLPIYPPSPRQGRPTTVTASQ